MIDASAGTVIHVRRPGLVAGAIRRFTRLPGEPPTESNHVALALGDGRLAEAVWTGPRIAKLEKALSGAEFRLAIPRGLTPKQRRLIAKHAIGTVKRAHGYGFGKIALHAADMVLARLLRRNVGVFRRMGKLDRYPICSYVVALAYDSVGLDFGMPYQLPSPDDILDFQIANPDKYVVREWELASGP